MLTRETAHGRGRPRYRDRTAQSHCSKVSGVPIEFLDIKWGLGLEGDMKLHNDPVSSQTSLTFPASKDL